jgi:hypothetical protein
MVLNITNTITIASLYGDNYDQWANQYIQVFATSVKAFGRQQMALRVRQVKPNIGQDNSQHEKALRSCKNLGELQNVFMKLPANIKQAMTQVKNEMKEKLSA